MMLSCPYRRVTVNTDILRSWMGSARMTTPATTAAIPYDVMEDCNSVLVTLNLSHYERAENVNISVGPYGRVVRITGTLLQRDTSEDTFVDDDCTTQNSNNINHHLTFCVAFKVHGKVDTSGLFPNAAFTPSSGALTFRLPKETSSSSSHTDGSQTPRWGNVQTTKQTFKKGIPVDDITETTMEDVSNISDDAMSALTQSTMSDTETTHNDKTKGRIFTRVMKVPTRFQNDDFSVQHDCDGSMLRIACFDKHSGNKVYERTFRLPSRPGDDTAATADHINHIDIHLKDGYLTISPNKQPPSATVLPKPNQRRSLSSPIKNNLDHALNPWSSRPKSHPIQVETRDDIATRYSYEKRQ